MVAGSFCGRRNVAGAASRVLEVPQLLVVSDVIAGLVQPNEVGVCANGRCQQKLPLARRASREKVAKMGTGAQRMQRSEVKGLKKKKKNEKTSNHPEALQDRAGVRKRAAKALSFEEKNPARTPGTPVLSE